MKCKVGDLAWYVGPFEPRKGQLFEVIEWLRKGDFAQHPELGDLMSPIYGWHVRAVMGPTIGQRTGNITRYVVVPDADLDPIRPPKITETETTDELEGVL